MASTSSSGSASASVTLPPLSSSQTASSHTHDVGRVQHAAASAALHFDFELRASGHGSRQGRGSRREPHTQPQRQQMKSRQSTLAANKPRTLSRQGAHVASSPVLPLSAPTTHSSSTSHLLPSHLRSPRSQLAYYLSASRGWREHDDDDQGEIELDHEYEEEHKYGLETEAKPVSRPRTATGGVSGSGHSSVLTPRSRYERLAESVRQISFDHDATNADNLRPLASSASSPAILAASDPFQHSLSTSTSTSSLSSYPSSSSLISLYSSSLGMAAAVRDENQRARRLAERYATLAAARKARRRQKKEGGGAAGMGMQDDDDDEAEFDDGDEYGLESGSMMESSVSSLSKSTSKRKGGLPPGQQLLQQIHAIMRSVAEEKEGLAAALAGALAGSKGTTGGEKRRNIHHDHDDAADGGDDGRVDGSVGHAASKKKDAALRSVIQQYLEASGIAGSVAAGGSSFAVGSSVSAAVDGDDRVSRPGHSRGRGSTGSVVGGGDVLKEREGASTFTTSKITRDVKLVLDYLKGNTVARQELMDRVKRRQEQKKLKKERERAAMIAAAREASGQGGQGGQGTFHPDDLNLIRRNQREAGQMTAAARAAERAAHMERERARLAAARATKAQLDSAHEAATQSLAAGIRRRFGEEAAGAGQKRVGGVDERVQRFQSGWLMLLQLAPLTHHFQTQLKATIQNRITSQVHSFLHPLLQRNYIMNVSARLHASRSTALGAIKRACLRWVRRWKWRRRRTSALTLYRFLTLISNANALRQGLKDSSQRSQVMKLQQWWRNMEMVIESQRKLLELKWNRREQQLIYEWQRKMRKEERLAARASGGRDGSRGSMSSKKSLPPHLLGSRPSHHSASSRRSTAGSVDFTNALTRFHANNAAAAGVDADSDGSPVFAPKRIPKSMKRSIIKEIVRERRAEHRTKRRAYTKLVDRWQMEHAHEIELVKARRELANKQQMMLDQDLAPPPAPTFKLLPHNTELDQIILQASKQYVLSKLRGATMTTNNNNSNTTNNPSTSPTLSTSSTQNAQLSSDSLTGSRKHSVYLAPDSHTASRSATPLPHTDIVEEEDEELS